MNSWRLTLASGAAALLLSGCGFWSSTAPNGLANNALPGALSAHHATSSQQTLIYTTMANTGSGVMYTYPGGSQQTYSINPAAYPAGLCSDDKGDLFLTGRNGEVEEYAFGATSPTATASLGEDILDDGCTVDETTGNLAMVVAAKNHTYIAVLSNLTAPAKMYTFGYIAWSLTYDNKGNIFVLPSRDGRYLGELKKGSHTITHIPYSSNLSFSDPSFIQWDGKYLAITAAHSARREGVSHWIYRCKIANNEVQLVSIVKPLSFLDPANAHQVTSWIQPDRNLFVSGQPSEGVSVWAYPGAGKRLAHFSGVFTHAVVAAPASE